MSQQLIMVGLSDSTEEPRSNKITPDIVSNANRNIRGWDTGIIDTSFLSSSTGAETNIRDQYTDFMFKLSGSNVNDLNVSGGMASAYGYDIISHNPLLLNSINSDALNLPAIGTKYVFVYLKWDMSNPSKWLATIDIYDNGSNPIWQPTLQDNLESGANGTYIMPLHRVGIDVNGNVVSGSMQDYTTLNVKTYTGVRWSELSKVSDEAKLGRAIQSSANSSTAVSFVTRYKNSDDTTSDKTITMEY